MKKLALGGLAVLALATGIMQPAPAEARVAVVANFGCCGGGYYGPGYYHGYYGPGYYGAPYYYPYYVAPPPVVYSVPTPAPVVYAAPQQVVAAPPPAVVAEPPAVSANQTSPTFIDSQGRTCRQYQSTGGGSAFGTACLQPDGSWRAVQ